MSRDLHRILHPLSVTNRKSTASFTGVSIPPPSPPSTPTGLGPDGFPAPPLTPANQQDLSKSLAKTINKALDKRFSTLAEALTTTLGVEQEQEVGILERLEVLIEGVARIEERVGRVEERVDEIAEGRVGRGRGLRRYVYEDEEEDEEEGVEGESGVGGGKGKGKEVVEGGGGGVQGKLDMIVESLDGIVYRLETLETKSTLLHQEVYSVATRQSDLKRALIQQQQQQQQQPSSPSVSVGGAVGGADDLTHRLMSIELNMESLASAYVESLDSALSRQTTAFLGVVEELLKDPHGGLQRAKAAASGSPAPSPSVSKRASMRLSMPVVPDMGIKEGLSRLAHSLSRSGSSLSVVEDQEEEVAGVPGSVAK